MSLERPQSNNSLQWPVGSAAPRRLCMPVSSCGSWSAVARCRRPRSTLAAPTPPRCMPDGHRACQVRQSGRAVSQTRVAGAQRGAACACTGHAIWSSRRHLAEPPSTPGDRHVSWDPPGVHAMQYGTPASSYAPTAVHIRGLALTKALPPRRQYTVDWLTVKMMTRDHRTRRTASSYASSRDLKLSTASLQR